jgi:uncharacterized protein (TIGR00369 family)
MTDTEDVAGAALMREFIPASPFAQLLGLTVQELSTDRAVLTMPDRPELVTMEDTVHGGALASLLDTAAMAAAWCTDQPPPSLRGATAALTVTYLAPATGAVLAAAQVLSRGRSLVTVEVSGSCDDRPVARALVTHKLG